MSSVQDWYTEFLSRRSVPLKRELGLNLVTEGFALVAGSLQLTKLHHEGKYRISFFFYDGKTCQFFGAPYHTKWNPSYLNEATFSDELFFHCPLIDNDIILVVEVVEDYPVTQGVRSVAWGVVPIFSTYKPVAEYGRVSKEISPDKINLHPGSPKVLTFGREHETDICGSLHCTLYTHPAMLEAVDFIPEFCLVSSKDIVPGLVRRGDEPQLACPVPLPRISSYIDEVGISFGPNAERIEQMLLEDINTERVARDNITAGASAPKMQVIERRLRIGVHNGFTYLSEPLMVHLSSMDEQITGTHSLRRKGRPLSRSNTDFRTEMNTLFVRSKVSLPSLVQDDRITIVFALDYLLGVRNNNNSICSQTQSIIVCWGAWTPFHEMSKIRERVTASVALCGGPRPNPDEVVCYKNLLHIFKRDDSAVTESQYKIVLQFAFILESLSTGVTGPSRDGVLSVNQSGPTPQPRKEQIRASDDQLITDSEESDDDVKHDLKSARRDDRRSPDEYKLPPIVDKPRQTHIDSTTNDQIDKLIEKTTKLEDIPREIRIHYETPWKMHRISNIPRSIHSVLIDKNFTRILDRNGDAVELVDAAAQPTSDLSLDMNDRLDTNEVIIQLMAYKSLQVAGSPSVEKIFLATQFYRFPDVVTEQMLLNPTENNSVMLLQRIASDGSTNPNSIGFTIKLIADRDTSGHYEFLNYLKTDFLTIEVWNAVSLQLIGTCLIPLKMLLRGGREAVQSCLQCPVVNTSYDGNSTITSFLYLNLANIGHPSSNQIDMVHSRTTAVVSRRLASSTSFEGPHSYRILAKPLNSKHDDTLRRFLHAQRIDIQQRYDNILNGGDTSRIREWERLKDQIPLSAQKTAFKQFVFDEQLEAYKRLRNESKAAKLLQAVFKGITLSHQISPCFGEKCFFEYLLENTHPEPINCVIEVDETALRIVDDVEEWKFYKHQNKLQTPLEANMFQASKDGRYEVFLKPMEAVYVPFVYDDFRAGKYNIGETKETKVLFRRWDSGEPLSILDLRITHRSPVSNRIFRFYGEETVQFQQQMLIDGIQNDRRIGSVRCSDASNKVQLRNNGIKQHLAISCFCGQSPTSRSMIVNLYADSYQYKILATWRIIIHSVKIMDVRCTLGQTTKQDIVINKSNNEKALLQFHCSADTLRPTLQQPMLLTNEITQLGVEATPKQNGLSCVLASIVDCNSQSVLALWMFCLNTKSANITKRFQIALSILEEGFVCKKLPFTNPYSIPTSFNLSFSRPELVQLNEQKITVPPNGNTTIPVFFKNYVRKPISIEILLFIQNAETSQIEETYSMSTSYSN